MAMNDPPVDVGLTLQQMIEDMRKRNCVALAIVSYNMNEECLVINVLRGIIPGEVEALLRKIKITGNLE